MFLLLIQDVLHPCAYSLTYKLCEFNDFALCELDPFRSKFLDKTIGSSNLSAVQIWAHSVTAQSFCVLFESLSS